MKAERSDTALKPCPFCGGPARYDDFRSEYYGLDVPGVECPACNCRNFAKSKDEAIAAWNRRVDAQDYLAAEEAMARVCNELSAAIGWPRGISAGPLPWDDLMRLVAELNRRSDAVAAERVDAERRR